MLGMTTSLVLNITAGTLVAGILGLAMWHLARLASHPSIVAASLAKRPTAQRPRRPMSGRIAGARSA
jgi:hypothetical protein